MSAANWGMGEGLSFSLFFGAEMCTKFLRRRENRLKLSENEGKID